MPDSIQSLLEAFPEGVVQLRAGLVQAANEQARQYLPQLALGAPLPVELPLPEPGKTKTGSFVLSGTVYAYSCKAGEEEQFLLLRPGVRGSSLEDWQLDGALRQLRELLGDILAEVASAAPDGAASPSFNRTFHRLFRLIGNLEFMQQMTEPEDVPFCPTTIDLDALCQDIVLLAGDLLQEAGVTLEYTYKSKTRGLLIPGDRQLLQKLLLGLISNAVRAGGGGSVALTLRRLGNQARLLVSNGGGAVDGRQLDALFQVRPGEGPPLPGQGAGLGLFIARHIVSLHGGTLLPYGGASAPGVLVSLPAGTADGRTSVHRPPTQLDGGLNPVLVELSDVLPASIFGMEGLD